MRKVWGKTMEPLACGVALLVGTTVLIGWTADLFVQSDLPGMATMKVNTAACMVLIGIAFSLIKGAVCSALVLPVAGLTLLESLSGRNLGLDQALFNDPVTASTLHPGGLAPNTAMAFILSAAALLLLPGTPECARLTGVGLLGTCSRPICGWPIRGGYSAGFPLGLGVNSYLVKPVDFDNFSAAVAELGHHWLLVNQEPKCS